MRTNSRRVDLQLVKIEVSKFGCYLRPSPTLAEAIEALIDAVPVPEAFGKVSPLRTGFRNPEHGVDKGPVVVGGCTRISWFARNQVFDAGKSLVADGVSCA